MKNKPIIPLSFTPNKSIEWWISLTKQYRNYTPSKKTDGKEVDIKDKEPQHNS